MSDDADLLEFVALAQTLDLFIDMLGQFFNTSRVEGIEKAAQIKAEHAEAIAAQAFLYDGKGAAGGSKAVKHEDRMFACFKIGQPLDLVALKGESNIGQRIAQVPLPVTNSAFDASEHCFQV